MSDVRKVIVLGATGSIGTNLIEILTQEHPHWEILAVSRSGAPKSHSRLEELNLPQVKFVPGDVLQLSSIQELCQDDSITLVYCCVGFPKYETKYWSENWPIVVDNLLQVTSERRPLIFCDNLYAYGPGTNISPSTPTVAPSNKNKPAIRALIRGKFQARMDEAPKSICVLGGADFFGPGVTDTSFLGDVFFGNLIEKKTKPLVIGSGKPLHDFCYARDFSNAMATASTNPTKSYGKFWICPHAIRNKTMKDIAVDINALLGKDEKVSGVSAIPAFMVRAMGLFVPFMAEMKEMLPFWTRDYTVDDSDFIKTFDVKATPYEQALKETIAYYQSKKTTKAQ